MGLPVLRVPTDLIKKANKEKVTKKKLTKKVVVVNNSIV
jgi:hypothetical protein